VRVIRMILLLLIAAATIVTEAQTTGTDGEVSCTNSFNVDLDAVCRTASSGDQYCESDPYHRRCANSRFLDNGREYVRCVTCIDSNSTVTAPGSNQQSQTYDDPQYSSSSYSPIIVDAGTGTYALSGTASPVNFDLDADGVPETTTWTAAGSSVAFLALDRNANGTIDDGRELFGNHTLLADGTVAGNGFDALAVLDANHDGRIDAADPIWSSLLLWTDADHDGRATSEELQPVSRSSIVSIALAYREVGRRDGYANVFRYQGEVRLVQGVRPIYDVFFRVAK
jgi:hypothetical protein